MNDYEWLSKQMESVSKANVEQAARIAALEAEKAKLIEALIKAESALTYANWDGEFDSSYTAKDVINARDTARAVLAEVTGHAK